LRILALQVPTVDSPNFRPARPPGLVYGASTSMGGFPFRERGSGASNRYNLDYRNRKCLWALGSGLWALGCSTGCSGSGLRAPRSTDHPRCFLLSTSPSHISLRRTRAHTKKNAPLPARGFGDRVAACRPDRPRGGENAQTASGLCAVRQCPSLPMRGALLLPHRMRQQRIRGESNC
jgi:hypothetical protein